MRDSGRDWCPAPPGRPPARRAAACPAGSGARVAADPAARPWSLGGKGVNDYPPAPACLPPGTPRLLNRLLTPGQKLGTNLQGGTWDEDNY